MSRRGKHGLNCTGTVLPAIQNISPSESPNSLDDFCQVLNFGDEALLYDRLTTGSKPYYWVIVAADDYPMAVCELEAYANYMESQEQWVGRRSDYLLMGSHQGRCLLIVVELRHVLVKEEQEDNKFAQLQESIAQLIQHHLAIVAQTGCLAKVYKNPELYTIIGVIIAPGNTRSFGRGELNQRLEIASHPVLIRTLPSDALLDCRITWTSLLDRIGLYPTP